MSEQATTPAPSETTKTNDVLSELGEDDWILGEGDISIWNEVVEEEEPYYNTEDFISKPYISPDSTLPEDVVEFDYSYGYDCQKLFNLCVVDKVVLIFASGNIIHFFDTSTNKKWYRRCYSGCGIGHITKNPKLPHIAIGEKGENPLIIIYEWPSFEIVAVLQGGTKTAYTYLNYSPDGELLCSQGHYPDYMLTIWNWRKHKIMLRSKAYGQTVFNSRFSLYVPGHLTTSGISHIKFWKINRTFTGLKLLGELGRFGKSEICNIIGFLALPDEKVVSGCEWGNILVWDGGLIRVEVFRRGKAFCHDAPITQFIYNNGDLTTIAMDGTIKVWYYETIELADPPEEDRYIEVEPIFEIEVGDYYHKAKLLLIVESDPENPDDHIWYGQDGNGGIWKLDLSISVTPKPPTMVLECHAGRVAAIQASPFSAHLASLGQDDGWLFIHDLRQRTIMLRKEFLSKGRSLLWLPITAEESGCLLIGGFADGVIRVICVSLTEFVRRVPTPTDEYINLVQVIKPHTKPVTVITINPKNTIVVTGSEDCTIFVFQISEGKQFVKLVPIGYVPVTGEVTHCTWKPKKEATILVSCHNGTFMEIVLPQEPPPYEPISYMLENVSIEKQTFVSIKSEVRRNIRMAEIQAEREAIIEEKRKELKERADAAGTQVDETIIEALQEELEAQEPDLPELYIPKIPNPVLFATYLDKSVWLSMGGYDAGYLYEYNFRTPGAIFYEMIPDGDDIEISTYHYYHNNKYLILGMNNGKIRVVQFDPSKPRDLSKYWSLSMHDNNNGTIQQMCFNYNYSYLFTCGVDGNIFSYKFKPENDEYKKTNVDVMSKGLPTEVCADIDDLEAPSLEQAKNRVEHTEKMKEANVYKRDLGEILKGLEKKFEALLRRNAKLPLSQQMTGKDLILDERIEEDLTNNLEKEMEMVKFKLAWTLEKSKLQHKKVNDYFIEDLEHHTFRVHGINDKDIYAETFRLKKLGPEFNVLKNLVILKLEEQEAKGRAQARMFSEEEIVETIARRPNPIEALLKQIMVICGDYEKNIKLRRLLRKYRERKDRLETRRLEWYEMMKKKPNPDKPDPEDVASIELAKDTVGDYQLKTAPDYKVPKNARVTTVHVYDQLLRTKEKIYNIKKSYNTEVLNLREKKQEMIQRHEYLREVLLEIAKEIPKEKIRHPPKLPTYIESIEFPEKKFEQNESGILEELPKRFRGMFKAEHVKKKELKLLDKEYEMLILEKRNQKSGDVNASLPLMKYSGVTGSRDITELQESGKDDQVMTYWEKETKKLRVIKRLYEQDGIIDEMDTDIRDFDESIVQLNEKKYQILVDLEFLELYLLTLHQEVLILKKFEAAEEEKENRLFDKLREKHDTQKKMNEINNRVESRNREIRRCEEEIKNLVTTFHSATADNKFYDFLRRIFKKKYRPPKVKSEDSESESESESSSSSEEEDAKSLDSKDMGPLRLDESVCPPGCDPALYDWTFAQRSARHTLELTIMEEKKQIDMHKKDYELLLKKIRLTEVQYLACKEDLEEYIREKQRNLNEVDTVVVLRLNQIQNFKSESEIEKISHSILFPSTKLTSLYKRIGELEKETQMEKQKHEKNRQHLTRMKVDVNHMKEMILNLTKEINEVMLRKFGTKVDIDDIEESLLKKLVADMHRIILDLEKSCDQKLKNIRQELYEKENEYARRLQDNTEKYNLLTVLQEQKLRLRDLIERQDKILCSEKETDEEEIKDMENLRKVIKSQESKINELKAEVALLKLKVKPKPADAKHRPEMIQRITIKSCKGELEEINEACKEELRSMYEEAEEIVKDVRETGPSEEDTERMRKLTGDMIRILPDKCKEAAIRRLSKNVLVDEALSKRCAEGILLDIIKTINTESFLEAMMVVKEILDSVVSEFEAVTFRT
ncbi:hypothetical protein RUM44_011958 [Polyplax serrata]|uniref:Cilia- and flagella-associated protein 44 n=1 Tax=Polyplax serrata TaxID=468196 RepID=A0ABR1BE73_POLSC